MSSCSTTPDNAGVIYKRNRVYSRLPSGFFSFEQETTKARMNGFGSGESIPLKDENGETWRGSAEKSADGTFRYTFRSAAGKVLSGLADGHGITLRDEKGKTWRGFID
jgi:hypothetical protein